MNSLSKTFSFLIFLGLLIAPTQTLFATSCINLSKKTLDKKASPYALSITKHAKRYGVDGNLVKAVMAVESCYNNTAKSPKQAQGLMQLIPATAERFGVSDRYDADQNIRGGTKYLRVLTRRFKGNLIKTLAAYNSGEGTVDKYNGVPPYKETQRYVKKVMHVYAKLSGQKVADLHFNNSGSSNHKVALTYFKGKKTPLALAVVDSRFSYNKKGRVSSSYSSPFAKGKPGRSGRMMNKLKAPHLYKSGT
jgi:hypothetical protein